MPLEINKIHCMDCLEGMKQIPDNSVDLIVTDPPYETNYMDKLEGLNRIKKSNCKHKIQSVDKKGLKLDWEKLTNQFYRILKKDTHTYIWCAEKQIITIIQSMQKQGFKFVQILIWYKARVTPDMTFGHKYMYNNEFCLYFQKGWSKLRSQKGNHSVIYHKVMGEQQKQVHPTQKPLKIFRKFIKNSSDENDLILDPFMGSGTTAVACKQLNRNFIGFEISQEYVDIANKRLAQENLKEWFDNGKD